MKMLNLLAVTIFALFPFAAQASVRTLTVTGHVETVNALQDLEPAGTPSGLVAVGDTFTLTAKFDLAAAQLTSLYDADPTINIYDLPGASVSLKMGAYSSTFSPPLDFNSWFQLWDGFGPQSGTTDAQSFGFFNYNIDPSKAFPFPLGSGLISESITVGAFDYSGTARSNDLISDIVPFDRFAGKAFSYGILNADTKYFVSIFGRVDNMSLSGVPEPSSWALMIIGFGAIGGMMRRTRVKPRFALS